MRGYLLKKNLFALLFLSSLLLFCGWNAYENRGELLDELMDQAEDRSFEPAKLEEVMSEELSGRMQLVELYGAAQRALGKREYNHFELIKDENGFLNYASFYREEDKNVFHYAVRVKRLQDYAKKHGSKVLFLIAPGKYDPRYSRLRPGMPVNDPRNKVNELVFYLRRLGVETVDLSQYIPGDRLSYEEAFFRTDHHWTVPAAFEAMRVIVDEIEKSFGEDLDPEDYYTDIANYRVETYPGKMLGSMGRDTGAIYSGFEDFTAIFPTEEGRYRRVYYRSSEESYESEGTLSQTLLNLSMVNDPINYYEESPYALYLDELRTIEEIENLDNPDGPGIFMIRDSYLSPVITFLAPMCGRIDAIWSLENMRGQSVGEYLKDRVEGGVHYDYILVEAYPYNINEEAFRFFRG